MWYCETLTAHHSSSVLMSVFDAIEQYAPGFRKLIVGKEVLTPPDLERIFGLTGGVSTCVYTQTHTQTCTQCHTCTHTHTYTYYSFI